MKPIAALALFVIFFCLQPASVNAQEATPSEKAGLLQELLVVIEAQKNAEAIIDAIVSRLEQDRVNLVTEVINSQEELTDDERQELKKRLIENSDATRRITDLFRKKIDFSKIVNEVTTEIYDKYYSADELRDLITFYKTPTGKKSIQIVSQLFSDSMAKTSEKLLPLVTPIIQEIMDEEKRKTEELLPKKAPAKKAPARRRRRG